MGAVARRSSRRPCNPSPTPPSRTVIRLACTREKRTVEFEIRFDEHPDAPASCSFRRIFPRGGETAVYVDSNGPGKFDDPAIRCGRPLSRFSMDDACNYVTSMIRSASKLLP